MSTTFPCELTKTTTITATEARKLLQRAVTERGADFVYVRPDGYGPPCRYQTEGGQPDCLIGLALSYIGPIPENAMGTAANVINGMYPGTPMAVRAAMQAAQSAQDDGATWGKALAEFDRVLHDRGVYL